MCYWGSHKDCLHSLSCRVCVMVSQSLCEGPTIAHYTPCHVQRVWWSDKGSLHSLSGRACVRPAPDHGPFISPTLSSDVPHVWASTEINSPHIKLHKTLNLVQCDNILSHFGFFFRKRNYAPQPCVHVPKRYPFPGWHPGGICDVVFHQLLHLLWKGRCWAIAKVIVRLSWFNLNQQAHNSPVVAYPWMAMDVPAADFNEQCFDSCLLE